jgi:hypothetical protein
LQLGKDATHLSGRDSPEQGQGGRKAALAGVGQRLAGAVLPGVARLDLEHRIAGHHVGEPQRQSHLRKSGNLARQVVPQLVLLGGLRRRAPALLSEE